MATPPAPERSAEPPPIGTIVLAALAALLFFIQLPTIQNAGMSDAIALLQEPDGLGHLTELWQLNLVESPGLCDAYNGALRTAALKIDPSYSNRLGEAIDLEYQLPNVKWLVEQDCNLSDTLTDLAKRLRIIRDSSRIDRLADTFDALARQ